MSEEPEAEAESAVTAPMQIALVSLFPEMFEAIAAHGVTGRAIQQQLVALST